MTDTEVTETEEMDEPLSTIFEATSVDLTPEEMEALRHEAGATPAEQVRQKLGPGWSAL
jgi:hypothetical protein